MIFKNFDCASAFYALLIELFCFHLIQYQDVMFIIIVFD